MFCIKITGFAAAKRNQSQIMNLHTYNCFRTFETFIANKLLVHKINKLPKFLCFVFYFNYAGFFGSK